MGRGGGSLRRRFRFPGFGATLSTMDFNALLEPVIQFFSTGIGEIIANIAKVFYAVLFPANADAASTIVDAATNAQ